MYLGGPHRVLLSCTTPSYHTQTLIQNGSDLDIRAKTVKLLQEIGVNLHDLELGIDFLVMMPKAQAAKEKTDKLDFIKIENDCASKDTIRKVKRLIRD